MLFSVCVPKLALRPSMCVCCTSQRQNEKAPCSAHDRKQQLLLFGGHGEGDTSLGTQLFRLFGVSKSILTVHSHVQKLVLWLVMLFYSGSERCEQVADVLFRCSNTDICTAQQFPDPSSKSSPRTFNALVLCLTSLASTQSSSNYLNSPSAVLLSFAFSRRWPCSHLKKACR